MEHGESAQGAPETECTDASQFELLLLRIADISERTDQTFREIEAKLAILPRLEAAIQLLVMNCEKLVSREEWERRCRLFDDAIPRQEGDPIIVQSIAQG